MPKTMGVTVKVTIDGRDLAGEPNDTVLDVAKNNAIDIPTMCYNPLFDTNRVGSCRLCLVEVLAGGRPGLQPSCTLPISAGLSVSTCTEAVYQSRRTSLELILTEHTQDCRNCAMSGNCNLARLCRDYDINGVPVCSECPNQREGCLLARGILCLGPLTYANCNAFCTRNGYPCEGCHTVMANDDVLRFGLRAYMDQGIPAADILEAAEVFSRDRVQRLRELMAEVGMIKEG